MPMRESSGQPPTYQTIRAEQWKLVELVRSTRSVAIRLDLERWPDELAVLQERIASEAFKVVVIGDANRGKSTLINAMLGEEVLPVRATATTAVVTEVKWGQQPRARLVLEQRGSLHEPTPVEVPFEQLAGHITVEEDRSTPSRYQRAEVFWPVELCRNGVEIVDTPGLDDQPDRERTTRRYLGHADAVVFVVDSIHGLGRHEQRFIETWLLPLQHEGRFFVCNRLNQVEPDDREQKILELQRSLSPYATDGDRIFFVNAKGALRARLKGDPAAMAASNLPMFERSLEQFLAERRGRAKLVGPAHQIRIISQTAARMLQDRESKLKSNADEIDRRRLQAEDSLNLLELQRTQLLKRIETHLTGMEMEVERSARQLLREQADNCKAWLDNKDPESKLTWALWDMETQLQMAVKELSDHIERQLQGALVAWQIHRLQPLLERRLMDLSTLIEQDLRDFLDRTDRVRADLIGAAPPQPRVADWGVSAVERLLASAVSASLAASDLRDPGANIGLGDVAKWSLPWLAAAVASVTLSLPFTALLYLGLSGLGLSVGLDEANKRVKDEVAKHAAAELRKRAPEHARMIARQLEEGLARVRLALDDGMRTRFEEIRAQNHALEAQQGADHDQMRQDLDELREAVNRIDVELASLLDRE